MKMTTPRAPLLAIVAALALTACASTGTPYATDTDSRDAYQDYGVVKSIEVVRQDSGNSGGVGIGTIAGALVGGVVGNQVGSGSGNTAATVLGAAGGAYIGHELENRRQQQTVDVYRIRVLLNDGRYQTLTQDTNGGVRVGDRVQVMNGVVQRY